MSELEANTVAQVLDRAAERWGEQAAVVTADGSVTFAELRVEARKTAEALCSAGLQIGERFAIWGANSTEWIVAALAGQLAGGVLVPINTRYKGAEAADILRRSKARFLFVTPPFLGTDYEALLEGHPLPDLRATVSLEAAAIERFVAQHPGDSSLDARIARIEPDSLCDILYTSGTTGAPKGVMCSHQQNVVTFTHWSEGVGLSAGDRYLIVNPFFHSFGYKAGWFAALLRGATIFPMPVFDTAAVLELIQAEQITFLPGAPTIFQSLLNEPSLDGYDTSSLRCAVTGAASVPVQLVKDMKHVLGFEEVYTAYGLTESTGVVSLCRSGDDFETIANTSGRAMSGVEVQITNEQGDAMAAGEAGEVWVRGFNVMQGYLDDPAATAEAITPDGWLKTGDIGVMDERGYLKITDRKKDMYICGGFNCYPAEIENLLLGHPQIIDVAVTGAPDARMGEVGHAYVVTSPPHPGGDAIIDWARAQMANYKVPRYVTQLAELPRNASGKVQKFLLEPKQEES